MNEPVRIVIAGGGTGGHVQPAVAVIDELKRRGLAFDCLWIGSRSGVEREAASRQGIPYRTIQTGKLRRYLSASTAVDTARLPIGFVQAWRILRSFKPHVVFSTGGFVSVPTVAAAARLAPIVTHEQTSTIGLATRINAWFADVLAVSFETSVALAGKRPRRILMTGNPVRANLIGGDGDRGRGRFNFLPDLPLVYVTGGARGASPLNHRIAQLLPDILHHCQILHQTGPASAHDDAERLRRIRSTWPEEIQRRYQVEEFIGDELGDVYAAATLIVGRAGAGTIAELALLGKPSVLVPLPGTGGDEQVRNARILESVGGAVVLPQTIATPQRLASEITALIGDPDRLRKIGCQARKVSRPDAARALADVILELSRAGSPDSAPHRGAPPPEGARIEP